MRNHYFGEKVKCEQNLYEDLIIESIKIYGREAFYMPRKIVAIDRILNEDIESRFDDAFNIEVYVASIDGFEGDGVLMSKFGLEIRNQVKLIVSRRRWDTTIGKWNKGFNSARPSEGDLIYLPMVKGLFEIKFVELETPFYQLNNLPVYKMTCELFEYRGEDIDTGVTDVDALQSLKAEQYRGTITYTGGTVFKFGELVNLVYPSGATGTAEVSSVTLQSDNSLVASFTSFRFADGIVHPWVTGIVATGASSGAVATLTAINTLANSTDASLQPNDGTSRNASLESKGDSYLDFTVHNPFGEPNSP